ncbi:MAG: hypothetical protein B0D92_07000 [Spirochaeta sp. LUC14_002_19_P3]|nr:MAG: hypothetical protein B0D92_07000 [Spirochaeta sp. LUC14_002_19_P3]
MAILISLLRGINVGGNNILTMRELTEIYQNLGYSGVKTYIQSGNVVCHSSSGNTEELRQSVSAAIGERYGFTPRLIIISLPELQSIIAANPFAEAEGAPKSLHFFFLEQAPPAPDIPRLESLKEQSEHFALIGRVFYLHAPNGIGRSKLAANAETALGVPVTARNWNTVRKLSAMGEEIQE